MKLCIVLFVVINLLFPYQAVFDGVVPKGAFFVPTKLSKPYKQELGKALITPESPGYKDLFSYFIDPMLKATPQSLCIFILVIYTRTKYQSISKHYFIPFNSYWMDLFHSFLSFLTNLCWMCIILLVIYAQQREVEFGGFAQDFEFKFR